MDEAVGARHDAAVGAIGICRRPIPGAVDFTRLNRPIADGTSGEESVSKRDRVNEWLKGRAQLPISRSERAIEFALRVIPSTDQRANPAAFIVNHHDRPF